MQFTDTRTSWSALSAQEFTQPGLKPDARCSDIDVMATPETTPWWELPGRQPTQEGHEAERERLRAELARAWRARLHERDQRRAQMSVTPPDSPPLAA